MFGELEIALGSNGIARRLGITRKLKILLRNVLRRAANLYVRTVGFVATLQRVGRFAIAVIVAAAAIITAAHTPVLTWSHSRLSRASMFKATVVPSCALRSTAGCDAVSDEGDLKGRSAVPGLHALFSKKGGFNPMSRSAPRAFGAPSGLSVASSREHARKQCRTRANPVKSGTAQRPGSDATSFGWVLHSCFWLLLQAKSTKSLCIIKRA